MPAERLSAFVSAVFDTYFTNRSENRALRLNPKPHQRSQDRCPKGSRWNTPCGLAGRVDTIYRQDYIIRGQPPTAPSGDHLYNAGPEKALALRDPTLGAPRAAWDLGKLGAIHRGVRASDRTPLHLSP